MALLRLWRKHSIMECEERDSWHRWRAGRVGRGDSEHSQEQEEGMDELLFFYVGEGGDGWLLMEWFILFF